MKRLRSFVTALSLMLLGLWVAARITEKMSIQDTDPESETFTLVTYFGGKAYASRATGLRSGSAVTMLGGMDIDLTGAQLNPGGATLLLKTRLGGLKVTVPPDWRVEMMGETATGENALDVPDPATLPDDAPRLSVIADTKYGGLLVTT